MLAKQTMTQTLKQMLKVLYAPHKVFKEIAQNPKYAGPIIVMILFVLANVLFGYTFLSKSYLDQTAPNLEELDKWTENTADWNSNVGITANFNNYINGTYYGNRSIQFSATNSSQVWAQLMFQGSLNGTVPDDYTLLSFRLKQLEPSTEPSNASLYLFSTASSNFYYNLSSQLNNADIWSNVTLSLRPESGEWQPINNPTWSNITGLKFEFEWPTSSNITILIDGIFFHGVYKQVIEQSAGTLFAYPISAFVEFTLRWVAFGGFLFLIPKIFSATSTWKPLLTIAGFVLITLVMQMIFFTVAILLSPNFLYSLEILGGVSGESEKAFLQVFGSISLSLLYIERVIYIWAIGLGAIATRSILTFSWIKAIFVSATAYLFSILVFNFLYYGTLWL